MANGLMCIKLLAIVMQICVAAGVDCRRHPSRVDLTTCCPLPELISEEIMEKCKELMKSHSNDHSHMAISVSPKISTPPPPIGYHDHKPHGSHMPSCFMSCVLNETGIVTGVDAKFNEAKLSEYLKVVLNGSTDLIPVVETSFKTCSHKAEKFYAEMQEQMQEKMKNRPLTTPSSTTNMSPDRMMHQPSCSQFAGRLMGCVFLKSFKSCPKTVWSNTMECNEMRDHVKKCTPKLDNNDD